MVGGRDRQRVARRGLPSSARNSDRSRTLIAAARPDQSGTSDSSRSYSFIADPPGRVDHDRVHTRPARTPRSCAGRRPPPRPPAGVQGQRAAAALAARDDDLEQPSIASTRAVAAFTGGRIPDWTHPVSMPTTARRGPRAATRSGSGPAAEGPGAPRRRRPGVRPRRARGTGVQQAAAGQPPVQPGALRRPQRAGHGPEPARVREQREDGRAQGPVPPVPVGRAGQGRPRLFGPGPGRLDELVVLHAGRAGGHARHAAQAAVEVLGRRRGQRGAIQDLVHQVDPAARGVHLLGPQLVGGTGRQAEPAVHAVVGHLAQPVGVLHHRPKGIVRGTSGGRGRTGP